MDNDVTLILSYDTIKEMIVGQDDNGIIYDGPDGRPRVYTPSKDREGHGRLR